MKEIVYIGNKFYELSDTVISPIYIKYGNVYERTDWGFVKAMLEDGEELHIRQATDKELAYFTRKLMTL